MAMKIAGTVMGALVLLTLIAFTESKLDDECCFQDWNNEIGKVVTAAKGKFADKKVLADYITATKKYKDDDPEGICLGNLAYKCEGTGKEGTCKCNTDAPFNFAKGGTECVGQKGSLCIVGATPAHCECTPDAENPGSGFCKSDGTPPGGTGGGGNGTDEAGTGARGANSESRVMWAIVAGLALLPIA